MKRLSSRYGVFAQAAVALAALVWGSLFAVHALAARFDYSDDEGYFLIALGRYVRPGPLDPATFSPYGPFYYWVQRAVYALAGLPVNHDSARMVTLFYWMASAILGGVLIWRISGRLLPAAAAMLACAAAARVLAGGPGHPQQVVLLLLVVACCLALPFGASRSGVALFLLGAVGAALVFTKINVGAFYLAGLVHVLVCALPPSRFRSVGFAAVLAYALGAPFLLARSHLASGSAGFCVVAALSTAATFSLGAMAGPGDPLVLRRALLAPAGAAVGALVFVAWTLFQGVVPSALFQGVLVRAAQQPGLLFLGFRLGPWPCLYTVAILGGVAAFARYRDRLAPCRLWAGALRLAVGLCAVFLLLRTDLTWALPLIPLGLLPPVGRTWKTAEWFPRLFLADMAATQFLQTYPVAGAQVGIASIPLLLWGFVCISDGARELGGPRRGASWEGAAAGLILAGVAAGMWLTGAGITHYRYPASGLEGAGSLHLPPEQARVYRELSGGIRANCSVLFTLPLMASFNAWSGVPQPSGSTALVPMKLITPLQEAPVLERLRQDPRACVLYNPGLLEFWQTPPRDLATQPLAGYILRDMPAAIEMGGYQIRVNPHRNAPWMPAQR